MKKSRSAIARTTCEILESRVLLSLTPFVIHRGTPIATYNKDLEDSYKIQVDGKLTPSPVVALTAPTHVVATANSATQVYLSWNATSGASGYSVYRAMPGGDYTKISSVSGNSTAFNDASVLANTSYSYYVVAFNKSTVSPSSSTASVTTPTIPLPAMAEELHISDTSTNSISLAWSDIATTESGYHVYRSTDGHSFSLVKSLPANAKTYTDATLPSGATFYYKVAAWNAGGDASSAVVSAATESNGPTADPIGIYSRYSAELVLAGTSDNDSIFVSQSGSTLTIIANGITTTKTVPANGLFIYSFGGSDTITIDDSVTVRTTIAAINGTDTTVHNADPNASIWLDSTDTFSGSGIVRKVSGFFQGVSKDVAINIDDPLGTGNTTHVNTRSLWGAGPVVGDVNQGGVGDCYFLSSLAAFANSLPGKLENMAVDMGDGTYAVQYLRGGNATYVRVDADLPTGSYHGYGYAHPGTTGDIWAMIMEKSYAYFRNGSNSYASLSSGWMTNVYNDLGIAGANLTIGTSASTFYNKVSAALTAGKPVTLGTPSSPTDLVGNHAYTLISVSDSGGQMLFTVRNPWGFSGDSLEDSSGYATLTFAQIQANFNLGAIAT